MRVLEEYSVVKKNDDIELKYSYRLIQSQYHELTVYGIEIERRDYRQGVKINEDKDSLEIVSPHRDKVKQIVMNLCENELSPIHLVDVLGEFIDGHAHEFDLILSKEVQFI